MSQSTPARERFLITAFAHSTRAVENFEALFALARRITEAEAVGFKIDPDSVEEAVKRVLGVD